MDFGWVFGTSNDRPTLCERVMKKYIHHFCSSQQYFAIVSRPTHIGPHSFALNIQPLLYTNTHTEWEFGTISISRIVLRARSISRFVCFLGLTLIPILSSWQMSAANYWLTWSSSEAHGNQAVHPWLRTVSHVSRMESAWSRGTLTIYSKWSMNLALNLLEAPEANVRFTRVIYLTIKFGKFDRYKNIANLNWFLAISVSMFRISIRPYSNAGYRYIGPLRAGWVTPQHRTKSTRDKWTKVGAELGHFATLTPTTPMYMVFFIRHTHTHTKCYSQPWAVEVAATKSTILGCHLCSITTFLVQM